MAAYPDHGIPIYKITALHETQNGLFSRFKATSKRSNGQRM
jgi:hypothetical protein